MGKWIVLVVLLAIGLVGLGDTLILKSGPTLTGTLVDLDSRALYLRADSGRLVRVDISEVASVELSEGKPKFPESHWIAAMTKARHELAGCRLVKQGTVLGGLLFVAGGYLLSEVLGHRVFGGVVSGLGAVVSLLGIAMPAPDCSGPLHRVEILARIGLDCGWVY
jgi:hypothetical protein